METLTKKVRKEIREYVREADFDYEFFRTKEDIVENVIEYLISENLIPEKPHDRDDNDELIEFIRQEVSKIDF